MNQYRCRKNQLGKNIQRHLVLRAKLRVDGERDCRLAGGRFDCTNCGANEDSTPVGTFHAAAEHRRARFSARVRMCIKPDAHASASDALAPSYAPAAVSLFRRLLGQG